MNAVNALNARFETNHNPKPHNPQVIVLTGELDDHGNTTGDEIPVIVMVGKGTKEFSPINYPKDLMEVTDVSDNSQKENNQKAYRIEYKVPMAFITLYGKHEKGWISTVNRTWYTNTYRTGLGGAHHMSARELQSGAAAIFPRHAVMMLCHENKLDPKDPKAYRQLGQLQRWVVEQIQLHSDLNHAEWLEFQKELFITMEDKVKNLSHHVLHVNRCTDPNYNTKLGKNQPALKKAKITKVAAA